MTASTPTRSQKQAAEVKALLRARNPLLWIKTGEEARVEGFLAEAAGAASFEIRFWDTAQGTTLLNGKIENGSVADIGDFLTMVQSRATDGVSGKSESRTVWVMRDPSVWLQGAPGAVPLRRLRNLARF